MTSKTKHGLREKIAAAKSESDIQLLLTEGNKFEEATAKTRRAWKHTAKKRIAYLTNKAPAVEEQPVVTETKPASQKGKKESKKGKEKYNANRH